MTNRWPSRTRRPFERQVPSGRGIFDLSSAATAAGAFAFSGPPRLSVGRCEFRALR